MACNCCRGLPGFLLALCSNQVLQTTKFMHPADCALQLHQKWIFKPQRAAKQTKIDKSVWFHCSLTLSLVCYTPLSLHLVNPLMKNNCWRKESLLCLLSEIVNASCYIPQPTLSAPWQEWWQPMRLCFKPAFLCCSRGIQQHWLLYVCGETDTVNLVTTMTATH